ncbi:hypothetical protein Tco_0951362 [Tanacetum coccineum]|uniref:Reverse transcriptase domain-containing protein n=1 Tax=Tanacetum coccineum TaxID=301880 RepID=A0ABQ5DWA5_9ASTR
MGDENLSRTLGDYSRPSHEGYRNTIELPEGNNVVPLRSDIIRLVQNGCAFHRLWTEDPNQHLKDFIKLVDLHDLNVENREKLWIKERRYRVVTVQSQMGYDGSDPKNDRHMKDGEENKNADGSKDSSDVAIPIEAVDEISSSFNNTLYGYFIGKRLAFPVVENYVKHAWTKFRIERTILHEGFFFFQFATRAGMEQVLKNGPWQIRLIPIVLNIWTANTRLKKDGIKVAPVCVKIYKVPIVAYSEVDAYTSTMCLKSWGRNTYARELVEVSAEKELVDSLVDNDYPKKVKEVSPNLVDEDGFIQNQPTKETTSTSKLNENVTMEGKKQNVNKEAPQPFKDLHKKDNTNGENAYEDDDDDDVEEVFVKQQRFLSGKHTNDALKGASTPVTKHWMSNGAVCVKGSRIILGWNPDVVNDIVISFDDQVMHMCVHFKADKKDLFCSWIYAHNRYQQRRGLWQNLQTHKSYIRERPWCLLGDFDVSLSIDDKSTSVSFVDTAMRDFQECVEEIEVMDVNSFGLRFTWNQKPRGVDGVLNKIDRIVANLEFLNLFEVKHLRHELDEVKQALDFDPSNLELHEEEAAYLNAFIEASRVEERFLQQNTKLEWLKLGDANSAYFYKVPIAFIDHYTAFLGQRGGPMNSTDLFRNQLLNDVAENMVCEVSNCEIRDAIFSMGDDKSLGPDELNHAIIALILKVATPMKINDYRPISYCNVLFKCISKILSNRMKDCLTGLVSLNQSAFVPGRRISYNILLTQELMHNYLLDHGPLRCAFKVDIQKAYDTVDWDFLKDVLAGFGFHPRMIRERGLWQGDPMSLYLFTLVMEILTLMLNRRVRESNSFTYHRHCSILIIINLCFADDLFLFAHGDASSAQVIMDTLEEFKTASGLTPSLPKSTAYFCNVLNYVKFNIIGILPFEEGKLPVKYLGVPLVLSRLLYRDSTEMVEKVKKWISDWKNKSLSLARRV